MLGPNVTEAVLKTFLDTEKLEVIELPDILPVVVAERIRPLTSIPEVPGSNPSLAV